MGDSVPNSCHLWSNTGLLSSSSWTTMVKLLLILSLVVIVTNTATGHWAVEKAQNEERLEDVGKQPSKGEGPLKERTVRAVGSKEKKNQRRKTEKKTRKSESRSKEFKKGKVGWRQ